MADDEITPELENEAVRLATLEDRYLAGLALPAIVDRLPPGYGAHLPLDRITEWIRTSARRTFVAAGKNGDAILRILNEEGIRGDAHLVAILAAHLLHIVSETHVPVEAVTALALLLVRHYERPRG